MLLLSITEQFMKKFILHHENFSSHNLHGLHDVVFHVLKNFLTLVLIVIWADTEFRVIENWICTRENVVRTFRARLNPSTIHINVYKNLELLKSKSVNCRRKCLRYKHSIFDDNRITHKYVTTCRLIDVLNPPSA